MSEALWVTGDTLSVLRELPDASVDLVMTSPPFLALRSYLPADDPAKVHEIGQEGSPGAFLDALLDITEECARVIGPYGSLCVELGDTYSGSGGAGGDYADGGMRDGQPKFRAERNRSRDDRPGREGTPTSMTPRPEQGGGPGWPLAKSLCLIPELYRFALAYGMNPLTGRTTDPWRIRNVVRWCRPNPPVGALGDKFRPGTSDLVIACKSGKRWFDLDAVREAGSPNTHARTAKGVDRRPSTGKAADDDRRGGNYSTLDTIHSTNGAPPLDWWEIPTAPYKGSHYATFPEQLVVRPVKSMCPLEVCAECGEPRRRITKPSDAYEAERCGGDFFGKGNNNRDHGMQGERLNGRPNAEYETLGWTDCGHGTYRPGRVLDPFGGSGTTLAVATGHGRDALGIDLDHRNADLARDRIGPMFFKEATVEEAANWLST